MVRVTELVSTRDFRTPDPFSCQATESHPTPRPGAGKVGRWAHARHVIRGFQPARPRPPSPASLSHSRGRKAPHAGSRAQDSRIFLQPPRGGAFGPLWSLPPRSGPGNRGVPWCALRLVACCAGNDGSPRRALSASVRRGGPVGSSSGRGLRDRAPRPTTRLQDQGLQVLRRHLPSTDALTAAAPFLSLVAGRRLCRELPAFSNLSGKSSLTHSGILSKFSEFFHILCTWHRGGRCGNQDA